MTVPAGSSPDAPALEPPAGGDRAPSWSRSRLSVWGLDQRIGGPVGRHAQRRGVFFDPAPWAILTGLLVWLATVYRITPCIQHDVTKAVDPYQRLCYSDIPVIYQVSGIGRGGMVLGHSGVLQSPGVVAVMTLCRAVARLFGATVGPRASAQQVLDAANTYWAIASVVLFVAFVAVVVATMLLGRGSDASIQSRGSDASIQSRGRDGTARRRSWDAFLVAASPVVLMAGLIDFSMVAVALAMASMLAWARRRPIVAGVLVGLACATSLQVAVIVFAVLLLCLRTTLLSDLGRYLGSALGTFLLCHAIAAVVNPSTWWAMIRAIYWSGTGLGSLWYVIQDTTGSEVPAVGWIAGTLTVAGLLLLAWLVLTVPRRPRVAQVAVLALLILFCTNKVFSPQFALLLVPLAALARPDWRDWGVLSVSELLYQCAVWAHLGGLTTPGGTDSDVVYWAAVVVRIAGEVWFAWGVVDDLRRPWNDPVRRGFTDDPTGGVLDHAPDGQDDVPALESASPEPVADDARDAGAGDTDPSDPGEVG
nr:hypothetical protein [Acidipropionibacterium timonense]